MANEAFWRRCSTCKSEIAFTSTYWVCNVSTCNRKRGDLVFCEVACWDAHVPLMRHRESWAEERTSPTAAEWQRQKAATQAGAAAPRSAPLADKPKPEARRARPASPSSPSSPRVIRRSKGDASETRPPSSARRPAMESDEILIVASKLKDYVRAKSGFNTSDRVMAVLSDKVRLLCDAAIRRARDAEQQTVMARDVE